MKTAHSSLSTFRQVVVRDDSIGANIMFGIGQIYIHDPGSAYRSRGMVYGPAIHTAIREIITVPPTLRELLADPVFRLYYTRAPKLPEGLSWGQPWQVWAVTH